MVSIAHMAGGAALLMRRIASKSVISMRDFMSRKQRLASTLCGFGGLCEEGLCLISA